MDFSSRGAASLVKGDPVDRYREKRAQKPGNVVEEEGEDSDEGIELP